MLRLESDLLEVLLAACDGKLADVKLQWSPQAALTVVMAAKGYPGSYQKGSVIRNLDQVSTAKVGCMPLRTRTTRSGTVAWPAGSMLWTVSLTACTSSLAFRTWHASVWLLCSAADVGHETDAADVGHETDAVWPLCERSAWS